MRAAIIWIFVYLLITIIELPGLLIIIDNCNIKLSNYMVDIFEMGYFHIQVSQEGDSNDKGIRILSGAPIYQRFIGWKMSALTKEEEEVSFNFIRNALSVYPGGMLSYLGVKSIVIGKNFQLCDHSWFCNDIEIEAGRAQRPISLFAIPISITTKNELLFINDLFHVFHHEVGHFITRKLNLDDWGGCNGGFTYSKLNWDTELPTPGFVTPYAKKSIDEDVAETFSIVMMETPATIYRISADRAIACKIGLIKGLLFGFKQ